MRSANLTIRFLVEMTALAALGYWGWGAVDSAWAGFVLAVAAAGGAALVWGLLVAPKARRRLDDPSRLMVEILVLGGAAAALWAAGKPVWGAVLGGVAALNVALVRILGQT